MTAPLTPTDLKYLSHMLMLIKYYIIVIATLQQEMIHAIVLSYTMQREVLAFVFNFSDVKKPALLLALYENTILVSYNHQ